MNRRRRSSSRRGFTLVELMVVVVIVGILGSIGVAVFRKQSFGSKSTEALSMIQSIRSAEERWKAENLRYLNVSLNASWYPAKPVGPQKRAFYRSGTCTPDPNPSEDCRWKLLNPTVSGPVQFGYLVNAGGPSDTVTHLEAECTPAGGLTFPAATEHWYVIQAIADANGDGVFAKFIATSFRPDVGIDREGE